MKSILIFLILTGCAPRVIVPPTEEELRAATELKKTVAILEGREENSKVKGFLPEVRSSLEEIFVNLGSV
ncbi:MAG: hypothetical protein DRI22_04510, partial [Caldiserica bacterium]